MTTTAAEFEQALIDLDVAHKAYLAIGYTPEGQALEEDSLEAIKREFRKVRPRAQYTPEKAKRALGKRRFEEVLEPFVKRGQAIYEEYRKARDEKLVRVMKLAQEFEIEPSEDWLEYDRHHTYTWSSAGPQYGKGRAQVDVAALEALGLEARVVEGEDAGGVFHVEVKATHLSIEALRRRSLMTVREFLKACWSRGLNPRVYNPFIPHGLEEKLGVTWQGRDVEGREEKVTGPSLPPQQWS